MQDDRCNKPTLPKDDEGPPINTQIRSRTRAVGPDKITVEMIHAGGDMTITRLTDTLNKMYSTRIYPQNVTKPVFIALPKKKQNKEQQNVRTIAT